MHFSLVKIIPEGAFSSNCFDDIILPLFYSFERLGFKVENLTNSLNPQSVNILFGTCLVPAIHENLPSNSIIFNLEQITSPSCRWHNSKYTKDLNSYTVWDYSHRNVQYMQKTLGLVDAVHVPLGYVPEMTRLSRTFPQDIDVLFYGTINERRKTILDELAVSGASLGILQSGYGVERDHAIARSRIVLNVHHYVPATLELPRLGYLWANSRTVVSELRPETEMFEGLEKACAYVPYENIVSAVTSLLRSKASRTQQAEAGFAAFSQRKQEDLLEALVGRKNFSAAGRRVPQHLHVGSGKDFRSECINIDINERMNPDIVLDVSRPLDHAAFHKTKRFGDIRLMPGSYKRITAFEVIEHVRDVPQTMRNFLDLLSDGGELELSVPYDLSLGAWQDPTHIHAFNEMSWIYYCEEAWRLGWRENRFAKVSLTFNLSDYGKELEASGIASDELLRTPRAVDGMTVVFRKRKSTDEDKVEHDLMARSFYDGAVGEWRV